MLEDAAAEEAERGSGPGDRRHRRQRYCRTRATVNLLTGVHLWRALLARTALAHSERASG